MLRRALAYLPAPLVLVAFCASVAHAQNAAVAARLGTTGLGFDVTARILPRLNARAGMNFGSVSGATALNLSSHGVAADVDFNAELHLRNAGAFVDWHPGGHAFRLSGGIVRNANRILLNADVVTTVTINDRIYTASDVAELLAEGKLGRRWAPYLGVGVGNPMVGTSRVTFVFDFGVFYQGQPTVTFEAQGTAANVPTLQDDLDTEAQKMNDKDLNKGYFKFYPVVSFGIAVRVF